MWATHSNFLVVCFVGLTLLSQAPACLAQSDERGDIGRFRYDYQQSINDKMRAFSAASYEELISEEGLSGGREKAKLFGGVVYNVNEWLRLEGGLGTYFTAREGLDDIFEVRLWQAATLDWPEIDALARWVVHHRFMLEERFQESDGWDTSLRGRYRLSFSVPINRYTVEPGAFYMPVAGELFWDINNDSAEVFADKATLSAGIGYQFNKAWASELRYTWQKSRAGIGESVTRDDNIIELRLKSTIRIRDYLKIR